MSADRTAREVPPVRRATADDARAIGRMLDAFNREYDDPTPGPSVLRDRAARMLATGDIIVFLIGERPDGLAQLQFRPSIWAETPDAYLAELYVVPECRGLGLGHTLLRRVVEEAVAVGATVLDLNTSVDDGAARRLYEGMGFVNEEGGPGGPSMLYYELPLPPSSLRDRPLPA